MPASLTPPRKFPDSRSPFLSIPDPFKWRFSPVISAGVNLSPRRSRDEPSARHSPEAYINGRVRRNWTPGQSPGPPPPWGAGIQPVRPVAWIPASAGMTRRTAGMTRAAWRFLPVIPFFPSFPQRRESRRRSHVGGNPGFIIWIPDQVRNDNTIKSLLIHHARTLWNSVGVPILRRSDEKIRSIERPKS